MPFTVAKVGAEFPDLLTAMEAARVAAQAAETEAQGHAGSSAGSATASGTSASQAAVSAAAALAAASATGPITLFSTKAVANTNIGSIANGAYIEVQIDESRSSRRTRYIKSGGAYEFVLYLPATSEPWIDAADYGLSSAASGAVNRVALQAAVDAAFAVGGGTVYIPPSAAAYLIDGAATHPLGGTREVGITLKSRVSIVGAPGATIKVENGSQTNAGGPLDLFYGLDVTDVRIAHLAIDMNAVGQTGWTGGYIQETAGCAIRTGNSVGGSRRIVLEHLDLKDCFSTVLNVYAREDVLFQHIRALNVGEGPQVSGNFPDECVRVVMDDVWVTDSFGGMAGDGLEAATCEDVTLINCRCQAWGAGTGGGSAFDVYQSTRVLISGCSVEKWTYGVGSPTGDMVVEGCVFRDLSGWAFDVSALHIGTITFKDCVVDTPGIGILSLAGGATGPAVTLEGVVGYAVPNGVHVNGARAVNIIGGYIEGVTNPVVQIDAASTVRIAGLTATHPTSAAVRTLHAGAVVRIEDLNASGCLTPVGVDVYPATLTYERSTERQDGANAHTWGTAVGIGRLITQGVTLADIPAGYDGQKLEIRLASGSRQITHTTNQLELRYAENVTLNAGDSLVLVYDRAGDKWVELSRTGGGAATPGLERHIIDGWSIDNLAASQTSLALERGNGTVMSRRFYVPKNAYVVAAGLALSEARSAGTATLGVWWDGAGPNYTVALASGTYARGFFGRASQINAGSYIELKITTDAGWLPTTADLQAWIELEY